jgi:hypothetical protein
VFGWLIKSHFSSGSELRKPNFRSSISDIRDRFGLVRDESLVDAHAQSLSRIREECAKLRNDIGRRKWDALTAAMTAYSGLARNDIENRDLTRKLPPGSDPTPPANFPVGRAKLSELLNEMLKQSE